MTSDTLGLWIDLSVQLQFDLPVLPLNLCRQKNSIIYLGNSDQKSYKNEKYLSTWKERMKPSDLNAISSCEDNWNLERAHNFPTEKTKRH